MINFQLTTYCSLLAILQSIEADMKQRAAWAEIGKKAIGPNASQLQREYQQRARVTTTDVAQLEGILVLAQSVADRLELPAATARIDRISVRLKIAPSILTASDMCTEVRTLREAIEDDAKFRHFYYYPQNKAEILRHVSIQWETSIGKFGKKFEEDVVTAVDCYALGHNMACVFHLMRIMEAGVQKFGAKLKVPLITKQPTKVKEKTWHDILNAINPRLTGMTQRTTSARAKHEQFSAIQSYLYAVKDAWRNPTMHPRAEGYNDLQTLDLIVHVRSFMNGLAGSL